MKKQELDYAIKFGAGRYIQQQGALELIGKEVLRHGKYVYIIAGEKAWNVAGEKIRKSLLSAGIRYDLTIHTGYCNEADAERMAHTAKVNGCQEIVGVGGGVIMDLAKAAAEYAGLGLINVPTSMATCAAFTNMSIMYTPDGKTESSKRYTWEPDGVIVDENIIVNCPVRYAAAGVLDAMAKYIEMRHKRTDMSLENTACDFFTAYILSEYSYNAFLQYGHKGVSDIAKHKVTKDAQNLIFLSIAVTGLLSNMTKSYDQSALAHLFYYAVRAEFTRQSSHILHGELVSMGLIIQLYFNQMDETLSQIRSFMEQYDLPQTLGEIDIPETEENLQILLNYFLNSRFLNPEDEGRIRSGIEMLCS